MLKCSKCHKSLPEVKFNKANTTRGYQYVCKSCHVRTYREYRKKFADRYTKARALQRYGLKPEEFEALRKRQKGKCGVCKCKPKRMCVDHDHKTGKIRGLLCHKCNSAIGILGDTVSGIRRALRYLLRGKA